MGFYIRRHLKRFVAKGEIAPSEQYLLLPQSFHLYLTISHLSVIVTWVFTKIDLLLSSPKILQRERVKTYISTCKKSALDNILINICKYVYKRYSVWQLSYGFSVVDDNQNIVAKGEIAPLEQFLLLPQCFQISSAEEAL